MPKIKAAICHEFGKPLIIEEVDCCAIPDPARSWSIWPPARSAIPTSPISTAAGAAPCRRSTGTKRRAGSRPSAPGVARYAVGDTVLVTLIRSCGHCAPCASGKPVLCGAPYDRTKGRFRPRWRGAGTRAGGRRLSPKRSSSIKASWPHIPDDMPMDAASLSVVRRDHRGRRGGQCRRLSGPATSSW